MYKKIYLDKNGNIVEELWHLFHITSNLVGIS
jgi:hypothetical protein